MKKKLQQNGWLSPDGKFIVVEELGHCEEADKIIEDLYPLKKQSRAAQEDPEHFLEKNGWIKLSVGRWHSTNNELTQSQLDFVFDWCVRGKIKYPPMNLEGI